MLRESLFRFLFKQHCRGNASKQTGAECEWSFVYLDAPASGQESEMGMRGEQIM